MPFFPEQIVDNRDWQTAHITMITSHHCPSGPTHRRRRLLEESATACAANRNARHTSRGPTRRPVFLAFDRPFVLQLGPFGNQLIANPFLLALFHGGSHVERTVTAGPIKAIGREREVGLPPNRAQFLQCENATSWRAVLRIS